MNPGISPISGLRSTPISGRFPSHLLPSAANRAPRGWSESAPPPFPARDHFRPGLRIHGCPTSSGRRAARLSAQARSRGPSRSPALPTLSRQPGGVSYSRASSLNALAVTAPCALRRRVRRVQELGFRAAIGLPAVAERGPASSQPGPGARGTEEGPLPSEEAFRLAQQRLQSRRCSWGAERAGPAVPARAGPRPPGPAVQL